MNDLLPWLTPDVRALLIDGLRMTIALTVITTILAFVTGVLVFRMRLSGMAIWRGFATLYIETFRNVPALVWVIFFAYALPNVFDLSMRRTLFFDNDVMRSMRDTTGILIPYYVIGTVLALTLNTSAYIAELLRAGVKGLSRDHLESARTLGANPNAAFWRLLVPHSLRTASPALITRLVHNMKNTALASFVAVPELFNAVQTAISRTFYATQLLLAASVMYWFLSWTFAWGLRRMLPAPRPNSDGR